MAELVLFGEGPNTWMDDKDFFKTVIQRKRERDRKKPKTAVLETERGPKTIEDNFMPITEEIGTWPIIRQTRHSIKIALV